MGQNYKPCPSLLQRRKKKTWEVSLSVKTSCTLGNSRGHTFGIITQGLTEYEVKEKSLLITLLRSTGVISNPKNPSRSTPAGPPFEVPDAQQLGQNSAEFSVAFFEPQQYQEYINIIFPPYS